jgi:hypothetical protein
VEPAAPGALGLQEQQPPIRTNAARETGRLVGTPGNFLSLTIAGQRVGLPTLRDGWRRRGAQRQRYPAPPRRLPQAFDQASQNEDLICLRLSF